MKYAVIGLGAIGSIIGAILIDSGEDVLLIGKQEQIDIISKRGLCVDGLHKKIVVDNVNVTSDYSKLNNIDVVFICVKSQDTETLSYKITNYLSPNTLLLSLQNGIYNASIIHKITGLSTLSAVVLFNALYKKPGEVLLTIKGGILLEANTLHLQIIKKISAIFNSEGIKTTIVDNIKGYLWSKLIVNLQIAVTALTGQTVKESIRNKDSRKIIIATMSEGIEIVEQSGITLKTLPGLDPKKLIRRLSRFNTRILLLGLWFMGVKDVARNSMLQSLSRGKPTEIDYINGEIIKLALKNQLPSPINSKIVELVKNAEKNSKHQNIQPLQLKEIINIS